MEASRPNHEIRNPLGAGLLIRTRCPHLQTMAPWRNVYAPVLETGALGIVSASLTGATNFVAEPKADRAPAVNRLL